MGSSSSKMCKQARYSVPCSEADRAATSERSVDATKKATEKNEKYQYPSTLQVDLSSSKSLGEKFQEQQQQQQEPSAVQPDITLQLASAFHDALTRSDGTGSTCFREPECLVELTVQMKRTSIPAAEPLKTQSKADQLKKERKAEPPKKDRKADPLKKQGNAELLMKKPPKACYDRRQQCDGAADVPRCSRQLPVGNWLPSSSNDAASARRPQPIGSDVIPTGLLPHVRHVTGVPGTPTYAKPSAADVYRYYRRLQRQRERSSRMAAAWIAGNDLSGNVGSVVHGPSPLERTSGDGAEKREL